MKLTLEQRIKGETRTTVRNEGMRLLSLYLLGYTLFGLLDTFFLGGIAHPQVTESVHQLVIGGVEFQRMEPGLAGL